MNPLMSRASTPYFVSVAKDVDGPAKPAKPGHDAESASIVAIMVSDTQYFRTTPALAGRH
jgi:hypothetical protein